MAIAEPQNARSRRTRAALLDAARELIERDGLAALTMASAAESAGVSRRAAYLHFASRGALLVGLYRHLGETEDLAASLRRVWDSPDAVTALAEWAHHMGRSHPRIVAVNRAVEYARQSDPDAAELWDFTMSNWYEGCTRLAEWLNRENALSPAWTVTTAADAMWGLMSWDLLERLVDDRGWSAEEFGDRLATLLVATFAHRR